MYSMELLLGVFPTCCHCPSILLLLCFQSPPHLLQARIYLYSVEWRNGLHFTHDNLLWFGWTLNGQEEEDDFHKPHTIVVWGRDLLANGGSRND